MTSTHARALDTLKSREGKATDVVLRSGRVCRVLNVVWGYDMGTDVAHITANINPTPEDEPEAHFFHADEITRIIDPVDGSPLFTAGGEAG